jgi:hypothetical protein
MEKNYVRNQMLSKGPSEKKDVSSKQIPKHRRRENQNNPKNNQDQSRVKQTPKNFKNYNDKRPPARRGGGALGDNQTSFTSDNGQGTGLDSIDTQAELHSVFVPGSKKQNLNHLLNFHYYNPRENSGQVGTTFPRSGFHKNYYTTKKYRYNKEQYLQANCQFVVKSGVDYRAHKSSPDILVDWDNIEQVIVSTCEENICPICLYPPKASKICRCGHIYCFSCMLHYLSLSDKNWRKCPICYEAVHLKDLKSAVTKQNTLFKVGDTIQFNLMRREKGSLYVSEAAQEIQANDDFPNFGDTANKDCKHSKLILAKPHEVLKILEREKYELEFQLIENGDDCPESIFVQQAIEIVKMQEEEIRKLMENNEDSLEIEKPEEAIALNPMAMEFLPTTNQKSDAPEDPTSPTDLFDEDCNLTLNDIEIIPTGQSNLQSKYFFYYQSADGQNAFLHSINSRMLQQMYGSLEKSPNQIKGKIIQIESCSLNEDLRKRLKYLQHLPVTSQFDVVEIEFENDILSNSVMNLFRDEINYRRKQRQRRDREERKREREIDLINDRQMGKMLSRSANINIESTSHFPACGDFQRGLEEMPALSVSSNDNISVVSASPDKAQGPSFATMLTTPTVHKSEKLWPSLGPSDRANSSFFSDKKLVQVTGNKNMMAKMRIPSQSSDDYLASDDIKTDDEEMEEKKVPMYKNNLGDALVNALNAVQLNNNNNNNNSNEPKSNGNGKKKKSKKTVLFASGMTFGGI